MSNDQTRNTWLFVGFLLLAGITNYFSRTAIPELDTLMTDLNYVILTGLLLFWIQSVRVRLLPSAARTSTLGAALLMLLYVLLRIFKYRFAVEPVVMRYAVYAYWIPQMLVPALFLMTCIRIRRREQKDKKRREDLLLIPAVLLALIVITNDLHFLVYTPKIDLSTFAVATGSYTLGPAFYLLYGWMVLTFVSGIVLLFCEAGHMPKKAVRDLLAVVVLWFGAVFLNLLYLDRHVAYRAFNVPDAHTFGLLGIFEVCIRHRLIPYNENYLGFFRVLQMPVLITDRGFSPVYRTQRELSAQENDLRAALTVPVPLTEDWKLHGKELRAGYAFWAEDESGIRRSQERLQETNETIEQENDLIRAETEQKEKEAYLQSRHRIYHDIAEELYPVQKKIGLLLDGAVPGTSGFRDTVASVSVLNAYVKRKTNLLLLASEKESLSVLDLFLALQESANYLTLSGLYTMAQRPDESLLPAGRIVALYDAFEGLAEQLLGKASSLMVSWHGGGLRLAALTDQLPDTDGLSLPVNAWRSEGIVYMDIPAGEEAAV